MDFVSVPQGFLLRWNSICLDTDALTWRLRVGLLPYQGQRQNPVSLRRELQAEVLCCSQHLGSPEKLLPLTLLIAKATGEANRWLFSLPQDGKRKKGKWRTDFHWLEDQREIGIFTG